MKTEAVPVECQRIYNVAGLDAIHAFWIDACLGAGYVTIICYGQAWTAYFGGMGGSSIRDFFRSCDTTYLVTKMGITPALKRSKRNDAYLGKIIDAVKLALKETPNV